MICVVFLFIATLAIDCPQAHKFGPGPPKICTIPTDPLSKPKAGLEQWFTKETFYDLFPKANLGFGAQNPCSPYSFESFIIAARYFPKFGNEYVQKNPNGDPLPRPGYTKEQTNKMDVSAFFAHSVQETGENDANLFNKFPLDKANKCFYRGGLYNWFEGGEACFGRKCGTPEGGDACRAPGKYWATDATNMYFYPVNEEKENLLFKGCYFGRGTIQISYNFNYGPFSDYLNHLGIRHEGKPIDLLKQPNLVMTKKDPPLAFMASLWFYMTPQPPKPAMHDIIIGNWVSKNGDIISGKYGPILGPTSLVINNECGGESSDEPGPGGENRRIKAFRFFCEYFKVPVGASESLSCKGFSGFPKNIKMSYDADWHTTWKPGKCNCTAQTYPGPIPYFDPKFFPFKHVLLNQNNKDKCEKALWDGWQDSTTKCKGRTGMSKNKGDMQMNVLNDSLNVSDGKSRKV